MNESEMNAPLDRRLARLPRELQPRRDLWADIAARLDGEPVAAAPAPGPRRSWPWRQLAAAVLVAGVSSLSTYGVMRAQAPPARELAMDLVRHELAVTELLPDGYFQARQELAAGYQDSLTRLSPATRQIVEHNLRDIERSLEKIGAALAREPGNATLQQLLLAASAQELQYLDEVRRLALNVPSRGA